MAAHSHVNVVLFSGDKAAPMTIVGANGKLRGMAYDLLSIVSLKTGLIFEYSTVDNVQLMQRVKTAEVDMFASLTPVWSSQQILFALALICAVLMLLPRAQTAAIFILCQIYVVSGWRWCRAVDQKISFTHFPDITLVSVDNESALMETAG
ncbi:transporter substrate-binding domain-containing protein (plasmid) [Pseudomonas silvicola]|nr:transporter substrate-binding domain-containing protein [Pseudomonas silvicola]